MSRRKRVLTFGSAVLAIALGATAGAVASGIVGEAIAIALASLGGIAIVALVFFEVGLSEDRERAREESLRQPPTPPSPPRPPRLPRRRRRG